MPTSSQQQQTSSAINHNNNHNHHRATPDEPPTGGDAANNHDDKQNYEGFRSRLDERISNLQLSKREINLMRLNLSLLDFPNEIPPSLLNNNSGRNYGGGGYDGSRPPGDDLNCSNASQNNANIKLIKRLANVATVKIGTLQMFFFPSLSQKLQGIAVREGEEHQPAHHVLHHLARDAAQGGICKARRA